MGYKPARGAILSSNYCAYIFFLCHPHQVKCYHKQIQGTERDIVFCVQFHTCTIHNTQLWFSKDELDEAWRGEGEMPNSRNERQQMVA